jgi:endogenous inhibitor of DNA gyrase (YacG/DUF329 family)
MTRQQCGTCGQPVTDQAHICHGCTGALTLDLQKIGGYRHTDGRWIPGLLTDLLTAATGAARIPTQGDRDDDDTRRTLDSRYPATCSTAGASGNTAALALHHEIWADITGWVRILLDDAGAPCSHGSCALGARPVCRLQHLADEATIDPCRWLEQHAATIRRQEWAPAMLADLDRHLARAETLVDLPDALTVPCPWCQRRVPIDPDADIIECLCKQWGTVDWWVEQVAPPMPGLPLTLAELVPWLRTRGYDVTPQQLRTWADRGTLPAIPATAGHGITRQFDARTALEAAEQSGTRRVVPTSLTL